MSKPIFTNKAILQMSQLGLSEPQILDTFNTGDYEEWSIKLTDVKGYNSVKKYAGYEIGVAYIQDKSRVYKITSVWKRERR
jgi:hypothetical protein